MRTRRMRKQRVAFTLIELLAVVAIIAALMALTVSVVMKFTGSQEEANTRSTLNKVQSVLNRVWSKVKDQAYREKIPSSVDQWIRTNLAGTDANATGRVRVIYLKLKMRQAFPMTFNEALTPPTLPPPAGSCPQMPPLPSYVTYLNSKGVTAVMSPPYQSSACLLMAFQNSVSGGGINADDFTAGGAAGMVGNLPYITDAWGRPIFFSRYPTGQLTAMAGANDPGDPQGYLQLPNWGTSVYGTAFQSLTLQTLASGGMSYKLAPMVASGGPINWTKGGGTNPGFDATTFKVTHPDGIPLFSNP